MPPHTRPALYTLPFSWFLKTHHTCFYLRTFVHGASAAGKPFPLALTMVDSWSFRVQVRCHLLRKAFFPHYHPFRREPGASHCHFAKVYFLQGPFYILTWVLFINVLLYHLFPYRTVTTWNQKPYLSCSWLSSQHWEQSLAQNRCTTNMYWTENWKERQMHQMWSLLQEGR